MSMTREERIVALVGKIIEPYQKDVEAPRTVYWNSKSPILTELKKELEETAKKKNPRISATSILCFYATRRQQIVSSTGRCEKIFKKLKELADTILETREPKDEKQPAIQASDVAKLEGFEKTFSDWAKEVDDFIHEVEKEYDTQKQLNEKLQAKEKENLALQAFLAKEQKDSAAKVTQKELARQLAEKEKDLTESHTKIKTTAIEAELKKLNLLQTELNEKIAAIAIYEGTQSRLLMEKNNLIKQLESLRKENAETSKLTAKLSMQIQTQDKTIFNLQSELKTTKNQSDTSKRIFDALSHGIDVDREAWTAERLRLIDKIKVLDHQVQQYRQTMLDLEAKIVSEKESSSRLLEQIKKLNTEKAALIEAAKQANAKHEQALNLHTASCEADKLRSQVNLKYTLAAKIEELARVQAQLKLLEAKVKLLEAKEAKEAKNATALVKAFTPNVSPDTSSGSSGNSATHGHGTFDRRDPVGPPKPDVVVSINPGPIASTQQQPHAPKFGHGAAPNS